MTRSRSRPALMTWLTAVGLLATALLGSPSLVSAQGARRPWHVIVEHRIENLEARLANRQYAPESVASQPRKPGKPIQSARVSNVTAGIVADRDGHVVTRLVNYDPSLPAEPVSVASGWGRASGATVLGLDYPTGLVVLSAPGLKGVEPPAADRSQPPVQGAMLRIIPPDYSTALQNQKSPSLPSLGRPFQVRVASAATSPVERRLGVVCVIEAGALTAMHDFSIVETPAGGIVGVVRITPDGRGLVHSIAFLRDVVRRVVGAKGHVLTGWLGASGRFVADFGEAKARGFLVEDVAEGSPARRAGINPGDLVIELDDMTVQNEGQLAQALAATPGGSTVTLGLIRSGTRVDLEVTLGAHALRQRNQAQSGPPRSSGPGLEFNEITADLRLALGIGPGAVVGTVTPESPAAVAGVRVGDAIVRIGTVAVANGVEAASALNSALAAGAASVEIEVRRAVDGRTERQSLVLVLTIPPRPTRPSH